MKGFPKCLISQCWKRIKNMVQYIITIPPNSSATVYLKAEKIIINNKELDLKNDSVSKGKFKVNLAAGHYIFNIYEQK